MLSWIELGAVGCAVIWLVWLVYINYFRTSSTVSVVPTATTASQDLVDGSTACVTLTNIAWKTKNTALADKVAEVYTLMSKVPA